MLRKFVFFLTISVLFSIIISQPVFAFEPEIHRAINNDALSKFMKSSTMNKINDQHNEVDKLTGEHFSPEWHFDDCMFQEGTSVINQQYILALSNLNPKSPNYLQASVEWGKLLHPAQDFYAHSNWLESGQGKLVDGSLQTWVILSPLSSVNGLVVIEGESSDILSSFKPLTVDSYHVVTTGNGKKGLISGSAYGGDNCPDEIAVGHWDGTDATDGSFPNFPAQSSSIWGTGLNKDYPGRTSHETARALAKDQTLHEWCRLVNLVDIQYGKSGVKGLLDNWTNSPEAKTSCKFPISFWTQVDASSTSYQMPDWIKTNARWWADGTTTDKEFASTMGFLVKEKIISVNIPMNNDGSILVNDNLQIPNWLRNNAKWWVDGKIQDSDFTSGVEYMIKEKVITFSEKKIVKSENINGKISNEDLKSLYLISKWQESSAISLSKLNDQQQKILKEFVVKKATDKQPVTKTITSLLQRQDIDKKFYEQIHGDTKKVSDEIKRIALKQGITPSELEKIAKITTEPSTQTPTPPANPLQRTVDEIKVKNNAVAKSSDSELAIFANQLSFILGSHEHTLLEQYRTYDLDPSDIPQLLKEYGDKLNSFQKEELNNILDRQSENEKVREQESEKQNVLAETQQALELAQKEEQIQVSILDSIPEPTLKELLDVVDRDQPIIKQDSTKIIEKKPEEKQPPIVQEKSSAPNSKNQVEIIAIKIDSRYYPLALFDERYNEPYNCNGAHWGAKSFDYASGKIRSIDGFFIDTQHAGCKFGKLSDVKPMLVKVPKEQADTYMKEWYVSPYPKDIDYQKYGLAKGTATVESDTKSNTDNSQTGGSPTGGSQTNTSPQNPQTTIASGPPVKWIVAEIIDGEYYPWAQFKIGYPGDTCSDRHVFSIYPNVRSLNGVYLTNPDPNHIGCGFGSAYGFNEVEDYPITQAQINSFKAAMGFEP